jgi:hypothetical protein
MSHSYYKGKRFACILLIQKAYKEYKIRGYLRSTSFPSLKMLTKSSFSRFQNCIKAYMLGWKVRKIINSENVANYKRNIQEIIDFYISESGDNKYVLRAKSEYIEAINRALKNPNWYQDLINSKTLEEKRLRVQKMREKNRRLRESKIDMISKVAINIDYENKIQTTKNVHNRISLAYDFSSG